MLIIISFVKSLQLWQAIPRNTGFYLMLLWPPTPTQAQVNQAVFPALHLAGPKSAQRAVKPSRTRGGGNPYFESIGPLIIRDLDWQEVLLRAAKLHTRPACQKRVGAVRSSDVETEVRVPGADGL